MTLDYPHVRAILDLAFREDLGLRGDVTTSLCVPQEQRAIGRYYARQDAILAGGALLPLIYDLHGPVEELNIIVADGQAVTSGQLIAEVRGSASVLLQCERTSLNFIQRLSGIATLARKFADAVAHTKCRVLDTRKTTPGLRLLEKYAAAMGGVTNHRMGLYDGILIKNNHIAAAGGVAPALARTRDADLPVEIEVRSRAELDEALANGARHLLLDNLSPAEAADWIRYINGRAKVELSGNIRLDTVRDYAETGADFVSSGSVTHSAVSADFNFRVELV